MKWKSTFFKKLQLNQANPLKLSNIHKALVKINDNKNNNSDCSTLW